MRSFSGLLLGLALVSTAGVSRGEACSMPAPSECANVGCVNEEIRSCESNIDVKRLSETPAGKENINLCLRRISLNESKGFTVDAVVAALITCQNKEAYDS
jgi:hypothetical protein